MAPEPNPRLVFERLFGAGPPGERQKNFGQRRRPSRSRSSTSSSTTPPNFGASSPTATRQKLDEYLTSVREIERRIEAAEKIRARLPTPAARPRSASPPAYREHIRLMCDMLALAFQTDSTRVATLILAATARTGPSPRSASPKATTSCSHHRARPTCSTRSPRSTSSTCKHFARFLEQARGDEGRLTASRSSTTR